MKSFRMIRPLLALLSIGGAAGAQTTQLVSASATGTEANSPASYPSIASDGRSVVFESQSDNLVPGATNRIEQIFLKDFSSGAISLVSIDGAGNPGDRYSRNASISEDGTLVVFESAATNFSNHDPDATVDLFLRDLVAGTMTYLIQSGAHPKLSADGRFVAFETDLGFDSNDRNKKTDVYRFDVQNRTLDLVSGDASGKTLNFDSIEPTISGDGSFVAFTTGAPLDPGDANFALDVYLRDLVQGTTTRVTSAAGGGDSDGYSRYPSICGDGSLVTFTSLADNLGPSDSNGVEDCFVKELATGAVTRVSVASDGSEANDRSGNSVFSGDGTTVVFGSAATNLVDFDPVAGELFVHHLPTGVTHMVSVADDGTPADQGGIFPAISRDGFDVAFWSTSTNLVPLSGGNFTQSYVRHRPDVAAAANSYGSGFPGTLGVPNLAASGAPILNSSVLLTADDSYGVTTAGLVAVGAAPASIPLKHGTLLVDVAWFVPVVVDAAGFSATFLVPHGEAFVGAAAYLQLFELDPGAAGGISMTQGLELILGY